MAVYGQRDIATNFSGELLLDGRGDLALAIPLDTIRSAVNFYLRTDFGEYKPDRSVGCNLGAYIGELNTAQVHSEMEYTVNSTIARQLLSPTDVETIVVPFDRDEALVIFNFVGTFDSGSGKFENVLPQKLAYSFPYIDGEPTPLTVQ